MATPIAALRQTPQKSDDDAFVQDVVNEIAGTSAPPPPQQQPAPPAQQQQAYAHPQHYSYPTPQPAPAPLPSPGLLARLATPEAKASAVAAAVAFVVWSPIAADLLDGLIERTPLRAHKLLARTLLTAALVMAVLEGLRKM